MSPLAVACVSSSHLSPAENQPLQRCLPGLLQPASRAFQPGAFGDLDVSAASSKNYSAGRHRDLDRSRRRLWVRQWPAACRSLHLPVVPRIPAGSPLFTTVHRGPAYYTPIASRPGTSLPSRPCRDPGPPLAIVPAIQVNTQ